MEQRGDALEQRVLALESENTAQRQQIAVLHAALQQEQKSRQASEDELLENELLLHSELSRVAWWTGHWTVEPLPHRVLP
jgi:hypothetical protein